MARQPTALGVYIFAGGFTTGVKRHFNVLAHFEGDNYGVTSARANFPDLPIHIGVDQWPVEKYAGKVDFLYGNPPCAAWSALNGKKTSEGSWKHDPRVSCTVNHFNLIEKLHPKVWVWESVARAFTVGRQFVDDLTQQALALGYDVSYVLHDAQHLGVPQRRQRFFMVVHRVPFAPAKPGFDRIITAGEALKGVKAGKAYDTFNDQTSKILCDMPVGEHLANAWNAKVPESKRRYREINGRAVCCGRPAFRYTKLDPKAVSPTMVGNSVLHWKEPRTLSINEIKALSGYPADFQVMANAPSAQADLLARAVLPPVGEWLAKEVLKGLGKKQPKGAPKVTLYDFRKAPGTIETIIY